jgi:hypothetical protein
MSAAFRQGASTGAASGPRSKRVSTERYGDRHVGAPPIPGVSDQKSEIKRMRAPRVLITYYGLLIPDVGAANKGGWCLRPAVTRVPHAAWCSIQPGSHHLSADVA